MGIDWDADKKIRDLILSWRSSTRLILIILALLAMPLAKYFIYYTLNPAVYYFSLFNTQFGGFFLLVFFLIWKRGETINIILASPTQYLWIGINNIWLRIFIYFTAIISFGFAIHAFRILTGMTQSPFAFPIGIFDFLIKTFFAPISEEMYSRFLILYITVTFFGRIPAILISTFIFTISHDLSQPHEVLWVAALGLTNALLVITHGTLWPAIGMHIVNNTVAYLNHPS